MRRFYWAASLGSNEFKTFSRRSGPRIPFTAVSVVNSTRFIVYLLSFT